MFSIGSIFEKLGDELVPDQLQWLCDLAGAGIDAAYGNFGGAASLTIQAASDGAEAAGQKGLAEGLGYASEAAGIIGGDVLNNLDKLGSGAAKEGFGEMLKNGLSGKSVLGGAAIKGIGGAAGSIAGGIAGGAKGARAGLSAGAGALSADPVKAAIGGAKLSLAVAGSALERSGHKGAMPALGLASQGVSLAGAGYDLVGQAGKSAVGKARSALEATKDAAGLASGIAAASLSARHDKILAGRIGAAAGALFNAGSAATGAAGAKKPLETAREAVKLVAAAGELALLTARAVLPDHEGPRVARLRGAPSRQDVMLVRADSILSGASLLAESSLDEALKRAERKKAPAERCPQGPE